MSTHDDVAVSMSEEATMDEAQVRLPHPDTHPLYRSRADPHPGMGIKRVRTAVPRWPPPRRGACVCAKAGREKPEARDGSGCVTMLWENGLCESGRDDDVRAKARTGTRQRATVWSQAGGRAGGMPHMRIVCTQWTRGERGTASDGKGVCPECEASGGNSAGGDVRKGRGVDGTPSHAETGGGASTGGKLKQGRKDGRVGGRGGRKRDWRPRRRQRHIPSAAWEHGTQPHT